MERRLFVKLSAFTAMALTLPMVHGCGGSKEMAVAQPYLLSQLVDDKTINQAGLAYRKTHAAEDNKEKLSQLLLGGKDAALGKNEIQAMLDKQVTADFKQGNTLVVKGWVMSVTEARQCALYSLLKS
ncbi:MAG: hypothetical protein WC615_15625 [Mucilaginibacter sp.]|jgi:hypothetical protein|uniref:hypothetical protein n=1 Tax=Mucilaginibacter sp. TaxID=1882438 RepID=UPI003567543E